MTKYVIININLISDSEFSFNDFVQKDINSLRISNCGQQCILKYTGPKPDIVKEYIEYTNEEVLEAINNENWLSDE